MGSLWFDPDPPSISSEEEARLEQIDRGETDYEFQERLDRSCSEILRPATEVEASADNQRPTVWEPPQDPALKSTIGPDGKEPTMTAQEECAMRRRRADVIYGIGFIIAALSPLLVMWAKHTFG